MSYYSMLVVGSRLVVTEIGGGGGEYRPVIANAADVHGHGKRPFVVVAISDRETVPDPPL